MNRINAKEARELVETSTKVLEQRVETVCKAIRKEAELGSNELLLKSYLYGNAQWVEIEKHPYYEPEFTPVQLLVKKELEKLGFTVDIYSYDIIIGGGPLCMDEGKPGKAYAIRVRW